MVLLELVRRQHARIDGGVGGGSGGGVAAAVHKGEAAPQAAAARVVRRPGGAAHPAPSSVFCKQEIMVEINVSSVGDPEPQVPHVFGPPGPDPDPLVRGTVRIRILPFSHKRIERTDIMPAKYHFNTKF
jgi:hypothetical protein